MAKETEEAPRKNSLFQAFEKLTATQLLYALLLVTAFLLGYLLARVQSLERNSTLGQAAPSAPGQAPNQPNNPNQPQVKVNVAPGHLPPLGNKNAKVTVVEFSDFQCPFCRRFFKDTLPQVKKDYIDTGKVALYYRHFPLSFHPFAEPAAEASECANEQGKFWDLHDKIFNEQEKLGQGTVQPSKDDLKTWAQEVGLNINQFNQCFDSGKYKDVVTKDTNDGQSAGVSGTPTFYINGTQLVGAQPFTAFKSAIDQELNKR